MKIEALKQALSMFDDASDVAPVNNKLYISISNVIMGCIDLEAGTSSKSFQPLNEEKEVVNE